MKSGLRIVLIVCSLCFGTANAQLVVQDWNAPGDGLILHDVATGIDWLNLTVTSGMSRNAVEAALSTTFSGFQYAGAGNLGTFFADAGITPVNVIGVPGTSAAVLSLLGSWGALSSTPGSTFSQFLFESASAVNPAGYLSQFTPPVVPSAQWSANITAGGLSYGLNVGVSYLGSALMRGGTLDLSEDFTPGGGGVSPIPEPESYALILAGLAMLGIVSRRRRQHAV
jgi:hypothetical protein